MHWFDHFNYWIFIQHIDFNCKCKYFCESNSPYASWLLLSLPLTVLPLFSHLLNDMLAALLLAKSRVYSCCALKLTAFVRSLS